jgi:hypothetical protein
MEIKTDKVIKVKDIFEITSRQEPLIVGTTIAIHNMNKDVIGFALVQKHFKPDPTLFLIKITSLVSTRKIKERRVPSWKT